MRGFACTMANLERPSPAHIVHRSWADEDAKMIGRTVRELLRRATSATLATLDIGTGHPYASLVEVATLPDARPVLLLSRLARHTRNLDADPRASLLIDQRAVAASAVASERATLVGTIRPSRDAICRDRYVSRYPGAATWAEFSDFAFWVMQPDHGHLIAGFGRISEVSWAEVNLACDEARTGGPQGAELLASVNDAIEASGATERVVGIDAEGVDLIAAGQLTRLTFGCNAASKNKLFRTIASIIAPGR
ncbi:MAG: pyridoxamine 5'-phosphate oxidase family protein [Hyphomicrobiaceae bacterium]|nr:pyridoxamine 5'-phosphate oxidase family protein [Hyphomicrobiaceae bacterium]